MKKEFERPILTIVLFEDDLATDFVNSGGTYGDGTFVDPVDPGD